MITQTDLVTKLDTYFNAKAFDERNERSHFPPGYDSILQRFATPEFWEGSFNGLILNNAPQIERVYLVVFPSQQVLDTIIAREVERGAPGALIFSHHLADYTENGPGSAYIAEPHLEELREHHISYYVCHAPLDCHAEISTSGALANVLKLKEQARFAPYMGGLSGVYGQVSTGTFQDITRKVQDACGLTHLRYGGIRNNGRPVQQVAIIAGLGGSPDWIKEAIDLGSDTFITGEWWLGGPGDWRARHREKMREFLREADVNLIAASHYATEAVVMRDPLLTWMRESIPAVDPIFIPQDDPWR